MIDIIGNAIKSTSKDTIKVCGMITAMALFYIAPEIGVGFLIGTAYGGIFTFKVVLEHRRK